MSSETRSWTAPIGALLVLILFCVNELALALGMTSMLYVIGRVAVVPGAGLLCLGATTLDLFRRKARGIGLLWGIASMTCVLGIILFQFLASFPLVKYLAIPGSWNGVDSH